MGTRSIVFGRGHMTAGVSGEIFACPGRRTHCPRTTAACRPPLIRTSSTISEYPQLHLMSHDSCPDAKQYIQVRSVRQLVGGRVETYPPTCPDNGGCLACWRRNGMESSPQAVRVRPFQTCTRIRSGGKRCSSAVCVSVSDADGTDEKNHLRSGEALWLAGEMCVRGGQCKSTSVDWARPGRWWACTWSLLLMVALIDPNHSLLMLRVLIRGGGLGGGATSARQMRSACACLTS